MIFLGWPNRISDATLSGGSWVADLPLDNVKNRQMTLPARTTNADLTSTLFNADIGQVRSLRAIALINHNLSASAMWRVKIGSSSGNDDIYNSGWLAAWAIVFDNDMLEWESTGWWEGTADDDYIGAPFIIVHVFDDYLSARYVSIEIDDNSNTDGYIQIGRVFLGGGFLPSKNVEYGNISEGFEDLSTTQAADSGSEWFSEKRRFRVARFKLSLVSLAEYPFLYELQRRNGSTGEVLFIPDVSDTSSSQMSGFVGRMRTLSLIEYPFPGYRSKAFEIKEIL